MPKVRLTDITVRNLPVPESGTVSYIDSTLSGFAVRVSPSGLKAFTLVHGKDRRRENLGRWPVVSIAKARKKAADILATHQLGIAHDAPKMTFEEGYTLFLTSYEAKNREKTVYEMKRLVKRHLTPKLRHRDLSEITTEDIASIIEKLIPTPAECKALFVASKTLFRWFERRKLIKTSPVAGLECPTIVESRDRVLSDDELRKVLSQALAEPSTYTRIIELMIRTAQREAQIAYLRAEWIDYERRIITWPKEARKGNRTRRVTEHVLPYTDAVAAILETLPKEGLLFPARGRETPFNGFSKSKLAFDAKLEGVAHYRLHDFRRNFSTKCAELEADPIAVERVLGHVIPGVAGIYNRFSYLQPMRVALEKWDGYLAKLANSS